MERKGGGFDVWAAHTSVFVASFCVMVVELVAGRLVSRHLGASLYTWTAVIGVILAGLAVGNYLGGRIADRFRAAPALCLLFLAGAFSSVAVIVANHGVGGWSALWGLAWPLRVALHVTLVFWLPAAVLGTIGPVVARMALGLGGSTGRTLGNVYAWGVVGSIAGTFATGYLFIGWMGVESILWMVAGLLAATGLGYAPRSRTAWAAAAALAAFLLLAHAPASWARDWSRRLALREAADPSLLYGEDSRYGRIEVRRLPGSGDLRGLYIDKLLHAQMAMDRPADLLYDYTRVFSVLTADFAATRPPARTLTIGGGGFVFPRYLQRRFPEATHDVVEIDPAVTRAALAAFGLQRDSPLRIHHDDGRAFVRRALRERPGSYDIVFVDAVNDYSVPYQLTTREFFDEIRRLLVPGGMVLVNSIDTFDSGRFVGALSATVADVFGEASVWTPQPPGKISHSTRTTLVLGAGVPQPARDRRGEGLFRMSELGLERYRAAAGLALLTDDHAPVEQLLAPVVRSAARELGATEALRRALARADKGDTEGYLEDGLLAVSLDPSLAEAHYNVGLARYARGDRARAIDRWRRAVTLDPGYFEAHFNLATALLSGRDVDGARRHFGVAVRLRPGHAPSLRSLALTLEASGDLTGALGRYREALAASPEDGEAAAGVLRLEKGGTGGGSIDPPPSGA